MIDSQMPRKKFWFPNQQAEHGSYFQFILTTLLCLVLESANVCITAVTIFSDKSTTINLVFLFFPFGFGAPLQQILAYATGCNTRRLNSLHLMALSYMLAFPILTTACISYMFHSWRMS